jgi:O-antigen/teichoic acid export membrane protein
VLALQADAILALLYSQRYVAGGTYLDLQLIAFGLYAFLDMYAMALVAAGRQRQVVGLLLLLVPLALLANVILIPYVGAVGAAIALALISGFGTMLIALLTYGRSACCSLLAARLLATNALATGQAGRCMQ